LEGFHVLFFWLAFVAYAAEAGLSLGGMVPASRLRSALFGGLVLHAAFLALRWYLAGHAPMTGLFESLTLLSFCTAGSAFLFPRDAFGSRGWTFVAALALLPQAGASLVSKAIRPAVPVLDTPWFATHVGLSFVGYGLFAASLALSAEQLSTGRDEPWRASGKAALWGFSAFSAGMVCGGVWAFLAWGSYWIWTAKEIMSVVLWLYFATLVHLKLIPPSGRFPFWTRRVESYANAAGYFVMLLTFLGVSLLMKSSHSFR
jgi:ABC-type transport system involved in cytochrome c biogenesis permease subunit